MEIHNILEESMKYLPSVTALFAVVLGPFVSLRIANKQTVNALTLSEKQINNALNLSQHQQNTAKDIATLQSQTLVLSKNRQDWISELRQEISEFINQAHMIRLAVPPFDGTPIPSEELIYKNTQDVRKELTRIMEGFYLSYVKINLLINPAELDHAELIKLLKKMHSEVAKNGTDVMKIQGEIIKKSQEILKREWERVKKVS